MKKLFLYTPLMLLFFGNLCAEPTERNEKLNQLFYQLKNTNNVSNVFIHFYKFRVIKLI